MAFGLLMKDNTPVDLRYRGVGYVPGGAYFPQRRFGIPPAQAARVPQYNNLTDVPGVPYGHYPASVPGVPYPFGAGMVAAPRGIAPTISQVVDDFPAGEFRTAAKALAKLGYLTGSVTRNSVYRAFTRYALTNGFTEKKFGTQWDDYAYQALVRQAGFAGMAFAGSATGCGDDGQSPCDGPTPLPGTATQHEDTGWSKIGTAAAGLATSFVNAFATQNNPGTGAAGGYCPAGYYNSGGRCMPLPSSSSMMTPLLIGGGLLAFFLLTRKGTP